MVKVAFSRYNIFRAFDQPCYLYVDTEGSVVRLKVYEVVGETTIVYVDDTATGTNRAGAFELQIWGEVPHGVPPTDRWLFFTVFVEVYDTNNRLLETHRLNYAYTNYNAKTVEFKDSEGRYIQGNSAFYVNINNVMYYWYGFTPVIAIPTPPPGTEDRGFIEFSAQKPKYYFVERIDKLLQRIGTAPGASVVLKSADRVQVSVDYDISNLSALTGIPVVGEVIRFILWLGVKVVNYGLVVGNWLLRSLGVHGWMPIGCEIVSSSPLVIRVYYESDPAPVVYAVVLAVVLGLVALGVAWAIRDIQVKQVEYEITKLVAQMYQQYYDTVRNVYEYAKDKPNSDEVANTILSQIQPPQVSVPEVKKEMDSMASTIEQLKSIILMIIIAAVAITALRILK